MEQDQALQLLMLESWIGFSNSEGFIVHQKMQVYKHLVYYLSSERIMHMNIAA